MNISISNIKQLQNISFYQNM